MLVLVGTLTFMSQIVFLYIYLRDIINLYCQFVLGYSGEFIAYFTLLFAVYGLFLLKLSNPPYDNIPYDNTHHNTHNKWCIRVTKHILGPLNCLIFHFGFLSTCGSYVLYTNKCIHDDNIDNCYDKYYIMIGIFIMTHIFFAKWLFFIIWDIIRTPPNNLTFVTDHFIIPHHNQPV